MGLQEVHVTGRWAGNGCNNRHGSIRSVIVVLSMLVLVILPA